MSLLIQIVTVAIVLLVGGLLGFAVHSFTPYAGSAVGLVLVNVPHTSRLMQIIALSVTFTCFAVSCVNQRGVPEGAQRTEAQRRKEKRADRFAIYAVITAALYTVGPWIWSFLDWIGADNFLDWIWKAKVGLPILIGIALLLYIYFRLTRPWRSKNKSEAQGSPSPAAQPPVTAVP